MEERKQGGQHEKKRQRNYGHGQDHGDRQKAERLLRGVPGYAMSVFNSNELWGGPGKRAADTVFPWSGCGDQAGPAQCGS